MNLLKRDKSFRNFIICLAGIVLIGICYFIYQLYKPYPLGDVNKLQYIGKVDYGCWLICDSNPASTYYYATDMSVDGVIAYFKNATVDQSPRTIGNQTDFVLVRNNMSIAINYYTDKSEVGSNWIKTDKKAIISIPSFNYQNASHAL